MKKIAILGTTPTRMLAPVDDPEWEIWTIGPGGKDSHRWDRLFEIHQLWPEDFSEYLDDLSKVKKPQLVYTVAPMPKMMEEWAKSHGKDPAWLKKTIKGKWASNVVIEREALFQRFNRRMWFSSSISYCIAMAIEEGATDIAMYGIDLESGEEYISQYSGCAHFIDLALEKGINIHLPHGCGLERDLNPYPDRYETHLALTFEKKRIWLSNLLAQKEPEYENLRLEVYRQEGRLLTMREYGAEPEKMVEEEKKLIVLNTQLGQAVAGINQLKGEKSATEFYQRMYVWGFNEPNDRP